MFFQTSNLKFVSESFQFHGNMKKIECDDVFMKNSVQPFDPIKKIYNNQHPFKEAPKLESKVSNGWKSSFNNEFYVIWKWFNYAFLNFISILYKKRNEIRIEKLTMNYICIERKMSVWKCLTRKNATWFQYKFKW